MATDRKKALCIRTECQVADRCQRVLAYNCLTREEKDVCIVNPMNTTEDASCSQLALVRTVCYARGIQEHLAGHTRPLC